MSFSISAYAYVGVEVVAASAIEARWPNRAANKSTDIELEDDRVGTNLSQDSAAPLLIGNTVKFSAIWISIIAIGVYVVGGVVASFDIPREDHRLPRLSWIDYSSAGGGRNGTTLSAFVVIAKEAGMPRLADAFNAFLVFTALTSASTNLYIASRSLFGLTSRLDGGGFLGACGELFGIRGRRRRRAAHLDGGGNTRSPLVRALLAALAWVGRTNSYRIPRRAMLVSAGAFIWVPFLQLKPGGTNGDPSTGTGMVWPPPSPVLLSFVVES